MNCRIKSEPHYRPFANAEEVMEAIKKHGGYVSPKHKRYCDECSHISWLNDSYITTVLCDSVGREVKTSFKTAFGQFTFSDGTPFGKLEE